MKTYNQHPQWHNQPLRLTTEQKQNPNLIIDEFFECFHLNEVREILWAWLTEIISSPNSISTNPLERSNHIYFYEKVEELIEAAYIIQKKHNKRHLKKNRNKRKQKTLQPNKGC
jgi:hypothetical protein